MAVVDVHGVGYEVLVPESVLAQLPTEGAVELYVRQIFREDGVTLYGFLEPFQRRMFDLLLEVKGCGPRIALSLLSQVGEDAVSGAILAQDTKTLIRATGVGLKLAERIVLELKEKIAGETLMRKVEVQARRSAPADALVDALLALGYRRAEAEIAADQARDKGETVEEQLRAALRSLAK